MPDWPYERDIDRAHAEAYRSPTATSSRRTFPLAWARVVAEAIVRELAPACERIEIAGSIRRGADPAKDIELVAIPGGLARDLFGTVDLEAPHDLDRALERLIDARRLRARMTAAGLLRLGPRFKALEAVRAEIPVDLFIVLPPAQWGAIFAIRTGPAEYSQQLVTACRERGLVCDGGRLRRATSGRIPASEHWGTELVDVPTPEERDFIEACGVPFVPPEQRR